MFTFHMTRSSAVLEKRARAESAPPLTASGHVPRTCWIRMRLAPVGHPPLPRWPVLP
jgi:hypothetical protein